jgi:Pyruvate/2-oxoacid:ferredoxin oxidoreductase delta subunit
VIAAAGPAFRIVLYEGADSYPLDALRKHELMLALLQKGYAVTVSRASGTVSKVGGQGAGDAPAGTMLVLGQFNGTEFPESAVSHEGISLHFRDIKNIDTAAVLELVESVRGQARARKPGGWKPWFPVIDYGRCTNCMQCLSFCLFDVYGVSPTSKIQVQNQDNCKTDCPACSRVCPEVAILFPKYRFGPVNGDEVNPDDLRREAMKVDISALLGGDIYAALRDRSVKAQSRFSKERDEDRALKERQRCLDKLHKSMDIPAEVLASLPSVDEIRAKANQAKARAEAALQAAGRVADKVIA